MPYDPKTGQYTPEDASVSKRLNGLLSKDNPYMQQAATQGLQAANRRGLLNSSMAVQASQAARIGAALPIAQQEAGQAHESNLQGTQLQTQQVMQGKQFEHEAGMQGTDIASREHMQSEDIAAQRELQAAQTAAEKERLGMQLTSQEKLALQDLNAAKERQQTDIQNQQWLAQFDADTRGKLQALDIAAQERIANLNVKASERADASRLAADFEDAYTALLATIMNNPEIPADVRQQYMDHAAEIRDSNYGLIEQMYGVSLQWQ